MNFDFTDDQEQLRDAVRKWVDKGYSFERRREAVSAGGFSRAAFNEMAELGLCGLYVSEADGGMGMGPVEGMVAMEELGRGIVLEPLTQSLIAGGVLSGYAPDAVKAQWLPQIASGEALVVLAYQERGARYQLDVCASKAAKTPAGWSVTASKSIVSAGDMADAFIVSATVDGKIALFLVERSAAGVSALGYGTQDGSRAADMKMQLELARSMSYYAALKLNAPAPERRAAMARAKYQLGNSMRFVGQQAVQLHGGIGVTHEYIVSHYFKKLTQLEMTFGDTLHHLGEVSDRMQDTAGVFA